jgi:hypothetical protein
VTVQYVRNYVLFLWNESSLFIRLEFGFFRLSKTCLSSGSAIADTRQVGRHEQVLISSNP